jgi:hypothetical protein
MWELRALRDRPDDGRGPGWLSLYITFQRADGRGDGGFGCGGVGLANEQRPVVLSVSGSYPRGFFCYLGQTVLQATQVELDLSDGTSTEALLLAVPLPVSLWVAITPDSAVPTAIRADDGRARLGQEPVDEHWLSRRASAVWGPLDE